MCRTAGRELDVEAELDHVAVAPCVMLNYLTFTRRNSTRVRYAAVHAQVLARCRKPLIRGEDRCLSGR